MSAREETRLTVLQYCSNKVTESPLAPRWAPARLVARHLESPGFPGALHFSSLFDTFVETVLL